MVYLVKWVGKSVARKEGPHKVTGQSKYIDDLEFPDMLFGVTVRSEVPRGSIQGIHFGDGVNWDEITVVTYKDIPGKNYVALMDDDQPYLAENFINHSQEPVLLLAHPDRYVLEKARRAVRIEIKEEPGVFSIEESLLQKNIVWGNDNTFAHYRVEKGNVDEVWNMAYKIVESEYSTGAQEQLYIEPNGMLATAAMHDGVTVWGSMQCPYYIHKALKVLFDLPDEKIRVVQSETGGGFGGKEEYPSMLAGHAALLALKTGRPVKMIYGRAEDMAATTKRHPSLTKIRTAVSQKGKLLGIDIQFFLDGGAYKTLSPVVLSRGTIHAAGPYHCPHVRIDSRAVATNLPPHGAFRGFGAPQSIFALERHLDRVAAELNMPPEELRRHNLIQPGQTLATGQIMQEQVDLCAVLDEALKESHYHQRKEQFAQENVHSHIKRGIGLACFMHGAGFTGSGEKYLASVVGVEANDQGKVEVLTSSTEIGQGTNTIFSQIAADTLHIDYDMIEVVQPDTAKVPNSGPTVASRTCMVVGKLVEKACHQLKATLLQSGLLDDDYDTAVFQTAVRAHLKKFGRLKAVSHYQAPRGLHWDDKNYRGDAYAAYGWAAYVAQVKVDILTYEVEVEDFVAVQEVGKVIHPVLAAGQIEGGVAQGIGYALYEKVNWQDGQMRNNQMTNYIMPTAMDVPCIRVFFHEVPTSCGPFGAKGIGELPMDGPAPAVVNAVQDALGISFHHVPLTPEDIMQGLASREARYAG